MLKVTDQRLSSVKRILHCIAAIKAAMLRQYSLKGVLLVVASRCRVKLLINRRDYHGRGLILLLM